MIRVVAPALDAQGPLPHRRQEPRRASRSVTCPSRPSRCSPAQARTTASSLPVERLVQPGLDVAPDRHHAQVGPQVEELGPPPRASRCRPGAPGKSVEGPVDRRDQGVGHVLARGHGGQGQPSGPWVGRSLRLCTATSTEPSSTARWISLVNSPVPADRGQGRVAVAVALRLDLDQLDGQARVAARRRSATQSACQRARRLPRVPIRRLDRSCAAEPFMRSRYLYLMIRRCRETLAGQTPRSGGLGDFHQTLFSRLNAWVSVA